MRRPIRRGAFLLALSLALVVPGSSSLSIAGSSRQTLTRASQDLTWSGELHSSESPLATGQPECERLDCDEFSFTIDLPQDVWSRPGGIEIGVHWKYGEGDIDLVVENEAGREIAEERGGDSDTESVVLPELPNGTYRVRAIGYSDGELDYRGLVQVEFSPKPRPVRDLLPNLVAVRPRNLYLGTETPPAPFGPTGAAFGTVFVNGCRPEEIVEQRALRCLRFDQIVANFGTGPFELRSDAADYFAGSPIMQRIYRSDGTFRDTPADVGEYHASHRHYHYKSFALSRLWRSDRQGKKVGREPVRMGNKNGFCLIDVENRWFGRRGDAPRRYGEQCGFGSSGVNGISVGWGDVYNWYLPDQFLELSGVPDGDYLLETVADPLDTVLESNEKDNTRFVHIRICGDHAEIAASGSDCP